MKEIASYFVKRYLNCSDNLNSSLSTHNLCPSVLIKVESTVFYSVGFLVLEWYNNFLPSHYK